MIVAVVAMRVVQMSIYQIIDMVTMRYWFMPASRSMNVLIVVSLARMCGSTLGWVGV